MEQQESGWVPPARGGGRGGRGRGRSNPGRGRTTFSGSSGVSAPPLTTQIRQISKQLGDYSEERKLLVRYQSIGAVKIRPIIGMSGLIDREVEIKPSNPLKSSEWISISSAEKLWEEKELQVRKNLFAQRSKNRLGREVTVQGLDLISEDELRVLGLSAKEYRSEFPNGRADTPASSPGNEGEEAETSSPSKGGKGSGSAEKSAGPSKPSPKGDGGAGRKKK